jgi:hypothetical protein
MIFSQQLLTWSPRTQVTTPDLTHLLQQLQGASVGIRFRMTGRDWQANYSNIKELYGGMVYIHDCVTKVFSYILITDIVQLELQEPLLNLEARHHYDVKADE